MPQLAIMKSLPNNNSSSIIHTRICGAHREQCAINTIKSSENSACTAQAAWNWSFCLGYLAISGKFQTLLIYSVRLWSLHIKLQNAGPVRSSAVLAVTDFSQATTGSACTVMKLAAAQPFISSWGYNIKFCRALLFHSTVITTMAKLNWFSDSVLGIFTF